MLYLYQTFISAFFSGSLNLISFSKRSLGGGSNSLLTRILSLLFLTIVCVLCLNCQVVLAHRPHDVVTRVELSPTFSQDQTLYIIVRNNLFKSVNRGDSWARLTNGLDTHGELQSLAISNSDKKILFISARESGIYRTEDAGSSWIQSNSGLADLNVHLVVISPQSSTTVFAATATKGLYKTDDGVSWYQTIPDVKITAVAFSSDSQTVLASDELGNFYRSENLGDTWTKIATLQRVGSIRAIVLEPDFSDSQTAFVATEKDGVYLTQDGAYSFQPVNQGLSDRRIMDLLTVSDKDNYTVLASTWNDGYWKYNSDRRTWIQSSKGLSRDKMGDELKLPHFEDLEISDAFATDGIAFLGGFDGLFRTEDSGSDWIELETLSTATIIDLEISLDYKNDATLAVASYVGGLYISEDGGTTLTPINQNLFLQRFISSSSRDDEEAQDPRRFFDLAFSPSYSSDHSLFATILWSRFLRSTNNGRDWSIIQLPREVRGLTMAISPNFAVDKTIYISTQGGFVFRSTNSGRTFKEVSKVDSQINNNSPSLVLSPTFTVDKTLFATGGKGIYKSVDRGENWQLLTEGKIQAGSNIQLAISPNYPEDKALVVSTSNGLFLTHDDGRTWQEIVDPALGEEPFIEGVAISPDYVNDKTFLVSVRGRGLLRTVDQGQSFQPLGNQFLSLSKVHNIPSAGYAVQFSPNYAVDRTLFGFGSATSEIFKSTDGGNTWDIISVQRNETGQPNFIQSVKLSLALHYRKLVKGLLVATLAGGIAYLLLRSVRRRKISFLRDEG
ncbi:MAG: glycosyl hydrolase [Leptolyngbyaceae cyanobacterium SM1_4_3]|nr:glycosyl hydrolase [Leptolyngbyaceae cyanobacterium SM1_4_3]